MTIRPTTRIRSREGRVLPGVLLLLGAVLVVAPAAQADPPPPAARPMMVTANPPSELIPDQYIVRLRPGGRTDLVIAKAGVKPLFVYRTVVTGFAAHMTPQQVITVLRQPDVASIEQDGVVTEFTHFAAPVVVASGPRHPVPATGAGHAAATTSWGLDRIDQRDLPLDHAFNVAHDGTGVTAYLVGSGIDPANSEFTGRIIPGFSAIADGHGTDDCLGRGTFVAGIVGGATWGVAPKVKLAPVRVLGCDGRGSDSGLIAGMDWVAANAVKPAVVNISIGGPKSPAVDDSANELNYLGMFVAAAAGDHTGASGDACAVSPASSPGVLAVAASTIDDRAAAFSNTGHCVNLFAPGLDVTSTILGGGAGQGSSTAYATPYVTGLAALFKQANGDAASSTMIIWLTGNATAGVLHAVPADTPNKLLFTNEL